MAKNIQNDDLDTSEYQLDSLARILLPICREYLLTQKERQASDKSNNNEK